MAAGRAPRSPTATPQVSTARRPCTRGSTGTPEPPASAAACAENRCGGSPSPLATGASSAPRAAAWGWTQPPAPPTPPTRPSSRPRPPTRRPSPEPATQPGLRQGAPRVEASGNGWKAAVGIRARRFQGGGREVEAKPGSARLLQSPGVLLGRFWGAWCEHCTDRGRSSSGSCGWVAAALSCTPSSPRCRTRVGSAPSFLTLPRFSFLQRCLRIRPPCILPSGASRTTKQPRRGAGTQRTQGCRGQGAAPSPAQRGPRGSEPQAPQFWGILVPEHQRVTETQPSQWGCPLPYTAHGRRTPTCRTSRKRMTPGAQPAPHLRTRTRKRKASSSGSPFPSPG